MSISFQIQNRCGTAVYRRTAEARQERVGSTVWGRAEHGLGLKSTAVMEFSEIDQRWMGVLSRTWEGVMAWFRHDGGAADHGWSSSGEASSQWRWWLELMRIDLGSMSFTTAVLQEGDAGLTGDDGDWMMPRAIERCLEVMAENWFAGGLPPLGSKRFGMGLWVELWLQEQRSAGLLYRHKLILDQQAWHQ